MKFNLIAALFILLVISVCAKGVKKGEHLMGVHFEIAAIHKNELLAEAAVDSAIFEIRRIENYMSSWKDETETARVNCMAGIEPVVVSEELYGLIKRSLRISKITNGAFDISFASINHVWKFDGSMTEVPSKEELKVSVDKIGYEDIILNDSLRTVFLKNIGMRISFGAIGKGYAANKAAALMKSMGIENGHVNASGDLMIWGLNSKGEKWRIGIADPMNRNKYISWLDVSDMAVVTSGNYEKFIEIDGQKYCHIIDPRTGWPVVGLQSVTIVCPNAELADALATSVMVLGEKLGVELINDLNGIECLIYTYDNRLIVSDGIDLTRE